MALFAGDGSGRDGLGEESSEDSKSDIMGTHEMGSAFPGTTVAAS